MPIDPAASDSNAVRFLIGDMDEAAPQLTSAEITFALDQANDNVTLAAAICARALAARYARMVDTKFETIESNYSQLRTNYEALARQLTAEAKRAGGMGLPVAGGVSRADVASADADTDRVRPFFRDGVLSHPPLPNE